MDQLLTYKKAKIGPAFNSTAYIYSCGVIIWAKFGLLRCYYLGQVCFYKTLFVKKHYKNRGFSTFFFKKTMRAQI